MNDPFPFTLSLDAETIEDQIDSIFHELELAMQWKRPSILFAIYNSKVIRQTAQDALERKILQSGQGVVHYQIEYQKVLDLTEFVNEISNKENEVYYIDPLNSESNSSQIGHLISMLNSCRGFLIDHLTRVVFWLTENEALNVAHQAPDFWASRHRVFEFCNKQTCDVQKTIISESSRPKKGENMPMTTAVKLDNEDIQVESPLLFDFPNGDEPTFSGINLLLMLGVANWKEGNQEKACEPLQAALAIAEKSGNKDHQVMCHKAIALVKSDSGKIDEAILAYNRVIELVPDNITIWNNLASLYQKAGRYEEALTAFNNAIKADPSDPVSWNGLGNIYANTGKLEEAINCYRKAIQFNASYLVPWIKLADILLRQKRDEDALYAFMRIVEMDKKNVHAWSEIGGIYLKAGSYEQAIDAYKKAMMLGIDSTDLQKNLAYAYTQAGYFVEAVPLFQKTIERETDNNEKAVLCNMLGDVYRRINDYESAVATYEIADKLSLNMPEAAQQLTHLAEAVQLRDQISQNRMAEEETRLESHAESTGTVDIATSETIKSKVSEHSSTQMKIEDQIEQPGKGEFAKHLDGQPESFDLSKKVVSKDENLNALSSITVADIVSPNLHQPNPGTAILWTRLAETYLKAGAVDKAIDSYQRAVTVNPMDGLNYLALAQLYTQKKDFAEAISFHKMSINYLLSDKEKAISYNLIGELYRLLKEYTSALESYEKAISLDPENGTILSGLSKIQEDLDQLNIVNQTVESQTAKGVAAQDNDMSKPSLAEIPGKDVEGKVAEVKENEQASQVEAPVKIDLNNANVWNELGNIFTKSNIYDEAIDAYNKALELNPEFGWSYSNLALICARQGNREKAESLYQKSIDLLWTDKDKAFVWNRLGDVYRQAGKYQDAIVAYQNADKLDQTTYPINAICDVDFERLFTHFVS